MNFKGKLKISTVAFVVYLGILIMIAEGVLMLAIAIIANKNDILHQVSLQMVLLDSLILAMVLSPVLYVLVFRKIRESDDRLNTIFNTLLEGVALNEMIFNETGEMVDYRVLQVNEAFYRMADFISDGPVVGRTATEIYQMTNEMITEFWKGHRNVTETVYTEMTSPISKRIFEIQTSPFQDNMFVTSFHDITEKKLAENELIEMGRVLQDSQEITRIGSYSFNIESGKYISTKTLFAILGVEDSVKMTPERLVEIIHPDDRQQAKVDLENGYARKTAVLDNEYRIIRPNDKQERWIHKIGMFRRDDDGKLLEMYGTIQDITEKKNSEKQIQNLAYFDQLTNLPNRDLLKDRFKYILSMANRNNESIAIFILDLDHFKIINDTLGHTVGDRFLKEIAVRLRDSMREEDILSRQGGDEFIVVLPNTDAEGAGIVANKLVHLISAPCMIGSHELITTASIGVSVFPADGKTMEVLLRNADTAMFRAKKGGRNQFFYYTDTMQKQAERSLKIINGLRHALEREEFEILYQPQVNIAEQKIIGVEALLRWRHPEFGLLSPADFIPIAEDTGQIIEIGLWVLQRAAKQAREWVEQGIKGVVMAVNISAVQFHREDLPDIVRKIIQDEKLETGALELELTEAVMMKNPNQVIQMIDTFAECGVKLAIDDFGTGFSSLSYLKQFKVNKIKIDRSFVKDIPDDQENRAIVEAIISMAASLGIEIIAEGVEEKHQLDFLLEHGCREAQGFYYSKPLTVEQFVQYAATMQTGVSQG